MEARLSLCFLCLLCSVALFCVNAEEEILIRRNRSTLEEVSRFFDPETSTKIDEIFLATDRFRDKRALGLILSGLAQVFGYTVTPVQVASLPNTAANGPTGAPSVRANLAAPVPIQQPASPAPTPAPSSTTQTPRQRETIRFTGVVNFGNNSNLYEHLRQYERIFHGATTAAASSSSSSTTAAPTPTPSAAARISSPTKPPLLTPLLVQIPIPIVPNLPPPVIPPADIKLSYPSPFVPVRQREEKVYMKQENKETYSVENKEFGDGREIIRKPEDQRTGSYVNDLAWKQMYEARLAQLERQQKEHAEKLKQQEEQGSHEKDKSREEGIDDKYRNREKQASRDGEHFSRIREQERNRYNEDDDDEYDSRERFDDNKYKEALKKRPSNDNEKFSKQSENDDFEDRPNFGHKQLPISEDTRKPDKLRNSYGEILEDEEEEIGGSINQYFDKSEINSRENDAESSLRNSRERHRQNLQKIRQEYASPSSRSKYEEYDIDRDNRGRKNDKKKTENDEDETTRKPYVSIRVPGREDYNDYDSSSEKDEEIRRNTPVSSRYVEGQKSFQGDSKPEKSNDGFDFVTLNPYTLPLRYLYAPADVKDAKLQYLASDQYKQLENGKDSRNFKEIDKNRLSPKIGPPVRPSGRQLHEGERKDNSHWPAPFDYVFDSTEQTNVVVPNGAQLLANENYEYPKSTSDAAQISEDGRGSEGEYEHYLTPIGGPQQNPGYSQNYNQAAPSKSYVPKEQNAAYSKEQIPGQYLDQYRYSIFHDRNLDNHKGTSDNTYVPIDQNRNNQGYQQVQNLQESKLSSPEQLYSSGFQSSDKDVYGTNQAPIYNYYNPPISPGGTRNLEIIRRSDDGNTKDVVDQSSEKIVESTTNTVTGTEFATAPVQTFYHYDDVDYDPDVKNAKVNVTEYKKKIATVTSSEETNEKKEEIHRQHELENKMTEILENLKTRLLVE